MSERILLIEDDERLAGMVADYLGGSAYAVTIAGTGGAGLSMLKDAPFDAVILDLMLPDMDGLNVCRAIRGEGTVPILMLTAKGDPMDRIIGLELGADDYLPKPFEPRELLQFKLLDIMARASGRVLSRDTLLDQLTGQNLEAFDRSIDVHISRIRAEIEDDPKHPRRVITVRGAGYVFARAQD